MPKPASLMIFSNCASSAGFFLQVTGTEKTKLSKSVTGARERGQDQVDVLDVLLRKPDDRLLKVCDDVSGHCQHKLEQLSPASVASHRYSCAR